MPKIKLSNETFWPLCFCHNFAKKFSKCVTLFYYFQSTFVLVPNNQNKFWTFPNSILTRISRLNPVKPKLILAVEDPAILWWFSFLNYGTNLMNQISSFFTVFSGSSWSPDWCWIQMKVLLVLPCSSSWRSQSQNKDTSRKPQNKSSVRQILFKVKIISKFNKIVAKFLRYFRGFLWFFCDFMDFFWDFREFFSDF